MPRLYMKALTVIENLSVLFLKDDDNKQTLNWLPGEPNSVLT